MRNKRQFSECLYVFKAWALFRNMEGGWMGHIPLAMWLTSESWDMLLPQLYPLHTLPLLHWAEFKPIRCASFSGSFPALCCILYTKQGWSLEVLIMYGYMRGLDNRIITRTCCLYKFNSAEDQVALLTKLPSWHVTLLDISVWQQGVLERSQWTTVSPENKYCNMNTVASWAIIYFPKPCISYVIVHMMRSSRLLPCF